MNKVNCKHEWVILPNDKQIEGLTYKCSKCKRIKVVSMVHIKYDNKGELS